jgi:hypothetical protein
MSQLVRWPVAVAVALALAIGGFAAPLTLAGPADQKGVGTPDIATFESAQFNLTGFFKVDGITVDVSGQGSLAPPDRSAATYKLGPITLETTTLGDQFYVRSRFDPAWEVQDAPSEFPVSVGPIVHSEVLPKGPFSVRAQERVDGKLTTKWSTDLDLGLLLALSELSPTDEPAVRDALQSLKATLDVWVGNDDRQLYKERILFTFTVPPIEPGGDPLPGSIDMTLQYSAHNQPVTIEAPAIERPGRRGLNFPKLQTLIQTVISGRPTAALTGS